MAGCAVSPELVPEDPAPDFVMEGVHPFATLPPEKWWMVLGDPALDHLVEEFFRENLDLVAASARIRQYAAAAGVAGSANRPRLDLGGTARRRRIETVAGTDTVDAFRLEASASWEMDLWRRVVSGKEAAMADFTATRLERAALVNSLVAELVTRYLRLAAVRAERAVVEEGIRDRNLVIAMTSRRYGDGTVDMDGLYTARESVYRAQADLALLARQEAEENNAISLLCGRPPGRLHQGAAIDFFHETPPVAFFVDAKNLKMRPDVAAAFARIRAADRRVAAAVADRYPSLTLRASGGKDAGVLWDLMDLDVLVWSIGADVLAPVMDGGRRKQEILRKKALLEEAVADWQKKVLTAIRETRDALTAMEENRIRLRRLQDAHTTLVAHTDKAMREYLQGRRSLVDFLELRDRELAARRQVITACETVFSGRIVLARVTGGRPGWAMRAMEKKDSLPSGEKK